MSDWRQDLARNSSRTYQILFIFIALYTGLGFCLDVYLATPLNGSFNEGFQAIIHGQQLPVLTLLLGGVAAIAILVTYAYYDRLMLLGTTHHIVTVDSTDPQETRLYHVVEEMTMAAGISFVPKIYIIEADYMNAFATGVSEKSALVAITRGALDKLDRSELQAVMAHELSHIRHCDIKVTLFASVLSNIMLMIIDLFFYQLLFSGRRQRDNRLFMIILVARYVLPLVTLLLLLYLSRTREYMADAGCVELMRDNEPLARALLKIQADHQTNQQNYASAYHKTAHEALRQGAYLYDPTDAGIRPFTSINNLFSTHPSLADRLRAIGYNR